MPVLRRGLLAPCRDTGYSTQTEANSMGKGDIRTRRGKITRGTFGARRRKKPKKNRAKPRS